MRVSFLYFYHSLPQKPDQHETCNCAQPGSEHGPAKYIIPKRAHGMESKDTEGTAHQPARATCRRRTSHVRIPPAIPNTTPIKIGVAEEFPPRIKGGIMATAKVISRSQVCWQ
jgi:hypothetical protein